MGRIVAFAELEEFIDAPLRTYSTGMAARLAFSVATDVDPDVLLIDEVLSVGDERFQIKSEARMKDFRRAGKTIVFVSHSARQVNETCDRAVWIHEGRVVREGPAVRGHRGLPPVVGRRAERIPVRFLLSAAPAVKLPRRRPEAERRRFPAASFCPNQPVTRGALAESLANAVGLHWN